MVSHLDLSLRVSGTPWKREPEDVGTETCEMLAWGHGCGMHQLTARREQGQASQNSYMDWEGPLRPTLF